MLAITWVTWKAALRFRLFWVIAVLLIGSVIILPLVIKDDGTARGFTQILLTYTLSVVTALLGLSTLWLSCGTLARDIEENQMQVVAVKPVARWQIWLGKWLGLVTLNAVLLAVAGTFIFVLLQWRAQKLPPAQQKILREEVLVARASLKEAQPDLETEVERAFQEIVKRGEVNPANTAYVKNVLREQMKVLVIRPSMGRRWNLDLGMRRNFLRDQTLFARIKFHAASTNELGTYYLTIRAGPPDAVQRQRLDATFAANTFHEVRIAPGLWNSAGVITIDVENHSDVTLIFPNDEGLELLYREGSFALNFARGLLVILFWLALMAALGLAAASFLSFPVAAFVSASLMVVALSSGTIASTVEEGTITGVNEETGQGGKSVLDYVLIPLFKGLLTVFQLVEGFSPIDALSSGRSIEWSIVALAFLKIVLLLGGAVAGFGIWMFARRELAAVNTQS
ncbi:MAG TPA: ABC transporter permease [Methylomirabilota bacterium]|nr:ABC transporter permease [Methylomirabilota bacterium]